MIRKLCFLLISFLMFCGTSNANVILDNFDVAPTGFGPLNSSDDVNRGGGFTSDLVWSRIQGTESLTFESQAYLANNFGINDGFSLAYSDFNGGVNLGVATGIPNLGGLVLPIFPNPIGDWQLEIKGTGFTDQTFNPIGQTGNIFFAVPGLSGATNVNLRFTRVAGMANSETFSYGGVGLDATAVVPEPTTLMMYGSLVFVGLTFRRRRK